MTTLLGLSVEVTYKNLPPIEVHGSWLPQQVEILDVILEIPDFKNKPRRVSILRALDESTLFLLEDEIEALE